ncbi:hypothetical protein TNCV_3209221 [Trichonephila clavipes]|nr:hypothetical protein TNCV_3209221 [Trichonephila clavipes]
MVVMARPPRGQFPIKSLVSVFIPSFWIFGHVRSGAPPSRLRERLTERPTPTVDTQANALTGQRAKDHQRHSRIEESVSMIGALTTDPDAHGTMHGSQPGTSLALS